MGARERKQHEYRLRLQQEAAAAEAVPDDDRPAAEQRIAHQAQWVEVQVQQAMRRGDFDNLPGAGKPIPGLDRPHDPDWWLKKLAERERIAVLPPALALRKEDAELDEVLDRETTPAGVRRVVEDFNARIVDARRQLQGGPPVITPLRDAEEEVTSWSERRVARVARQKAALEQIRLAESAAAPPSWWQRVVDWLLGHGRRLA